MVIIVMDNLLFRFIQKFQEDKKDDFTINQQLRKRFRVC